MAILSVLVVDDDPSLIELSRHFLSKDGTLVVETCTSARDALDLMESRSFDAIISDYEMPGMDGIGFLKYLRTRGDNTSFIIFTGKGREQVAIDALNNGADFYLQKGGDPRSQFAELRGMVQAAVQRRMPGDSFVDRKRGFRRLTEAREDVITQCRPV